MGLFDRFKKKEDDDFGDLSGLGDFGLDDKPGRSPVAEPSGMGGLDDGLGGGLDDLPSLTEPLKPGMQAGVPTHMEEVQPTQASRDMGNQLGLTPATAPHEGYSRPAQHPAAAMVQPMQAQPMQYPAPQQMQIGLNDLAKDVEIIHAKLDAIRSSLDSINQRLATIERMASGEGKPSRYTW